MKDHAIYCLGMHVYVTEVFFLCVCVCVCVCVKPQLKNPK